MVVPIGNIANKFFLPSTFSSSTMSNSQASSLPTVSSSIHMRMDIPKGQASVNDIEVRGRISTTAINLSRESLMVFSSWATPYYNKMDDRMDCNSVLRDKSPELSYKTEQEKAFCFSKVFETTSNTKPQDRSNEASYHNSEHVLNENQNSWFLMSRLHKMITMMSSTFSSSMIQTLLLNWTYGVVISTQFLFTVLSSK